MITWDTCFQQMSKPPSMDMLRALLEIQLRKCQAFKPHFTTIDGSEPGSHMRGYNYLYESAHQEIDRRRAELTRHQLTNPPPAQPGAASAKSNAKGTAKVKAAAKAKAPPAPLPAVLASKEACRKFLHGKIFNNRFHRIKKKIFLD